MNNQKPVFEYKGKVFVTMNKDIYLEDKPHFGRIHLEEAISNGDYMIDVKIYKAQTIWEAGILRYRELR